MVEILNISIRKSINRFSASRNRFPTDVSNPKYEGACSVDAPALVQNVFPVPNLSTDWFW
jgi:hypothetical protein